jgi:hypothetical protein
MPNHHAPLPFALVLLVAAAHLYADDLLDRFRKEYPAAAQKLEEAYSHSRAVGIYMRRGSGGALLYREVFDEGRRESAVLDISTYLQSNLPRISRGCAVASGGTAQKYFDISRPPGRLVYTIDDFGPDANFDVDSRINFAPLFAAYCAEVYRVADLLADPQATLKSAKTTTRGTEDVVEVEFRKTHSDGLVAEGSISFLQPSWAVASWDISYIPADKPEDKTSQGGTVEYGEMTPIPKVSKVIRFENSPTGPTNQVSWDVSNLQFVDIPEGQFELSAFGIKEPAAPIKYGEKNP